MAGERGRARGGPSVGRGRAPGRRGAKLRGRAPPRNLFVLETSTSGEDLRAVGLNLPGSSSEASTPGDDPRAVERRYRTQAALTRKRVQSLFPSKQAELKKRRMVKECGYVALPASKTGGKITGVLGAPGSQAFAPGMPLVLPTSLPSPWTCPPVPPPAPLSSEIPDETTPSEAAPDSCEVLSPQSFMTLPYSTTGETADPQLADSDDEIGHGGGSESDAEPPQECVGGNDMAQKLTAQTEPEVVTDLPPELTERLRDMDKASDASIGSLPVPADRLHINWTSDLAEFQGVRETFTGIPGPTFHFMDMEPVDVFLKFWDDAIMDLIVAETNRYAEDHQAGVSRFARSARWKPTDRAELFIFFALMIHLSLNPLIVEKDYWVSPTFVTAMPNWKTVISYDRWILLKKNLHFADNSKMPESLSTEGQRLFKIQPIIDHLNSKFQALYLPNQNIALDESLLKWHGHLTFIQKNATKAAKAGIKSYELCESQTGYLWKFFIYAGKDSHSAEGGSDSQPGGSTEAEAPQGVTAKIVYDLASGLFNKGHTIVMDNFYNSPLLARCLKLNGMDCYGALRLNRDSVPESLKPAKKTSLSTGNILHSEVCGIVWKDVGLVNMLSTYPSPNVGIPEKYGSAQYIPTVVPDYNTTMRGVDMKEALLAGLPLECKRNQIWYKNLFKRLLNASILNAYVIYRWKNVNIKHRDFRRQVADGLLKKFLGRDSRSISTPVQVVGQASGVRNRGPRPILANNHYNVKIEGDVSERPACAWCKITGKRNRTSRKCDTCNVPLCLDCMKPYHTVV